MSLEVLARMRALMAGIVVAFGVSVASEIAIQQLYPPGEGYYSGAVGAVDEYIASIPESGLWLMILGWSMSALVGALIACLVGRRDLLRLVMVVTVASLMGTCSQFLLVEYPRWVVISGVFGVLLGGWGAFAIAQYLGLERVATDSQDQQESK
ncbi:MAG: hypothetical protein KDB61_00460 [Planctomycetes bacterium]|nr:hypothetical protein [Planctomycetota bacterium]